MYALIHAVRTWRHLLVNGNKHLFLTDNTAVSHFMTQPKMRTGKQARWQQELSELDFELKHRPGKTNVVADALRRRPDLRLLSLSLVESELMDMVWTAAASDMQYMDILLEARSGKSEQFVIGEEGMLLYKPDPDADARLYIPASDLRYMLIREAHDPATSAHLGVQKTLERLQAEYYWPAMDKAVAYYVRTCVPCQLNKHSNQHKQGLTQPLPMPDRPWQGISHDFITGLPLTEAGHDAAYVVVCRLTKMIHVVPTHTTASAEGTAEIFFKEVFRMHGLPASIVSDRDSKFTSDFWQSLFKLTGTSLDMSTAYHPQTDGQTERANRTVEEMLRPYCSTRENDWDKMLPAVEFAYNSSVHASSGKTPFMLNYGFEPSTPLTLLRDPRGNKGGDFLQKQQAAMAEAKAQLVAAQARMSRYSDQHKRDHSYKAGDQVLLSRENLKATSAKKLAGLFIGPFTIITMVGRNAAKLELPKSMRVHPVFNVSLLKPYRTADDIEGHVPDTPPPPQVTAAGEQDLVEKLVNRRSRKVDDQVVYDYRVKWLGYDAKRNTWEPEINLREDGLGDHIDEYDGRYPRAAAPHARAGRRGRRR